MPRKSLSYETPPVYLGTACFFPELNRIERAGKTCRIPPKATAVLRQLVARAGSVVSRQELLDTVWVDRITTDDVLTQAVRELRVALGDCSSEPRFIETVPRAGYRLLVLPATQRPSDARWRTVGVAAALVTATAVSTLAVETTSETGATGAGAAVGAVLEEVYLHRPHALTSGSGFEIPGAFSPDGQWVAYSDLRGAEAELMLVEKATGREIVLTDTPGVEEGAPVWNLEGDRLIYRRIDQQGRCTIHWREAFGDTEGPVIDGCHRLTRLDLSSDGQWIAFSRDADAVGTAMNYRNRAIFRVGVDGSGLERISWSPSPHRNDLRARFSPDDSSIAFIRSGGNHDHRLMLQRIGEREATYVQTDSWVSSFDWHPNGRILLMAAHRQTLNQLEAFSMATGRVSQLGVTEADYVAVDSSGEQLLYRQWVGDSDIWQHSITDRRAEAVEADMPVITGVGYDFQPSVSPDGSMLAYSSTRSGATELYVRDLNTGKDRILTHRLGGGTHYATWSPDSRKLAFLVQNDKGSRVHTVGLEVARIEPVTALAAENVVSLAWSTDGQLYYVSERFGDRQLWRIALTGQAGDADRMPPELLSDTAVSRVRAGADGRIYFSREQTIYVLQSDLIGAPMVAELTGLHGQMWVSDVDHTYFVAIDEDNESVVQLRRVAHHSSEVDVLFDLHSALRSHGDIALDHLRDAVLIDRVVTGNSEIHVAELSVMAGVDRPAMVSAVWSAAPEFGEN